MAGSFVLRRGTDGTCPELVKGSDVVVDSNGSSNGKSTRGRCRIGESSFTTETLLGPIRVFIDRAGIGNGGGSGAAAARNLLAERDRRRRDEDEVFDRRVIE